MRLCRRAGPAPSTTVSSVKPLFYPITHADRSTEYRAPTPGKASADVEIAGVARHDLRTDPLFARFVPAGAAGNRGGPQGERGFGATDFTRILCGTCHKPARLRLAGRQGRPAASAVVRPCAAGRRIRRMRAQRRRDGTHPVAWRAGSRGGQRQRDTTRGDSRSVRRRAHGTRALAAGAHYGTRTDSGAAGGW